MSELGVIFYRGPSLLNGEPIIGVLTGLEGGSHNSKTGSMAQSWLIRPDMPPMEAVRLNVDDAICGSCALRGHDGRDRKCYVVPWLAPTNVYRMFIKGGYPECSWQELQALVEGRSLRLCSYGDPGAIAIEVWRMLLATAASWTAYTHCWRTCDPRLKAIAMASVDTEAEFWAAKEAGWRTFRVREEQDALIPSGFGPSLEFVCPASDEGQHRTTCDRCGLCRGLASPARSVAIYPHGHNGVMTAFHRSRELAEASR